MNPIPNVKELSALFLPPTAPKLSTAKGAQDFVSSVLNSGTPLEALGGTASSEAGTGQQNSSGSNFVNVGNPLQNIGAILQSLNSGPATTGGFPTLLPSPVARINSRSILPSRVGTRGVERSPLLSNRTFIIGAAALVAVGIFMRSRGII